MLLSCSLATHTQQQASLDLLNKLSERAETQSQKLEAVQQKLDELETKQQEFNERVNQSAQADSDTSNSQAPVAGELVTAGNASPASDVKTNTSSSEIFGRVEWLWLAEIERYLAAEMDTALEFSIIYAENIMRFERDGEPWLRFTILRNEWPSTVETKLLGTDKQRYLGENSLIKGLRVRLPVSVGLFNDKSEFLVIEQKRNYPQVVLGKNFLTDVALVDVSKKYLKKRNTEFIEREAARHQQYKDPAKAEFSASQGEVSAP